MNKFIEYDGNTWYLINGQRYRTRDVKDNPELLGYSTKPMEKGKGATNLFNQSITKVPPASPLPGLGKKQVLGPDHLESCGWTQLAWFLSGTLVIGPSSNIP